MSLIVELRRSIGSPSSVRSSEGGRSTAREYQHWAGR
jgi:hypothetical protein